MRKNPIVIRTPDLSQKELFALLGITHYNVANSTEGYNKINNWPLNFLRTGYYYYGDGYSGNRLAYGAWWSSINSPEGIYHLSTVTGIVHPQDYYGYRGMGFAIRCVVRER